MIDEVSVNFIKEIKNIAECKLNRPLTSEENAKISKPRSYMGLEAILDHFKYSTNSPEEFEKYISEL